MGTLTTQAPPASCSAATTPRPRHPRLRSPRDQRFKHHTIQHLVLHSHHTLVTQVMHTMPPSRRPIVISTRASDRHRHHGGYARILRITCTHHLTTRHRASHLSAIPLAKSSRRPSRTQQVPTTHALGPLLRLRPLRERLATTCDRLVSLTVRMIRPEPCFKSPKQLSTVPAIITCQATCHHRRCRLQISPPV